MPGLFAGVDHQLLPHPQPRRIVSRTRDRRGEALTVTLAQSHALERDERLAQHLADLGEHGCDLRALATAITINGTRALRAKNLPGSPRA